MATKVKSVRGWLLLQHGKPTIFETCSRKQFVTNWEPIHAHEAIVRAEVRIVKRTAKNRGA